jgi:hypothetical protein
MKIVWQLNCTITEGHLCGRQESGDRRRRGTGCRRYGEGRCQRCHRRCAIFFNQSSKSNSSAIWRRPSFLVRRRSSLDHSSTFQRFNFNPYTLILTVLTPSTGLKKTGIFNEGWLGLARSRESPPAHVLLALPFQPTLRSQVPAKRAMSPTNTRLGNHLSHLMESTSDVLDSQVLRP